MEVLAELVAKITADSTELKKGLTEADKDFSLFGQKTSKTLKNVGLAAMGAGLAIVAGLGLATKAAEEERIGIARLQIQLKNVGVAYDEVKGSLEGVISATQRKTGIADDQQRSALGDLILVTGDYQRALELLPLALDLAAAKQMDLGMAAELVGKVAQGNMSVLSRYGIVLDENATASEALAIIQERVAGAAEATASPFEILKASLSDMTESIGAALLPTISSFIEKATVIIEKIKDWIALNPELIKGLLAVGIVLIGAGGLLFALSQIAKAITAINAALIIMHAISGIGWLKLAAGIAVAALGIWGLTKLMESAIETTPSVGTVPAMQHGGIVTRPTLGLIGEMGPEAVIPLEEMETGITVNLNIQGSVVTERDLIQTIRDEFLKIQARNVSLGFA